MATTPIARALVALAALAVVWNVAGNLVLPGWSYVPVNLAAAAAAVAIARSAGLDWAELGLARRDLGRGTKVGLAAAAIVAVVLLVALAVPIAEGALEDDGVLDDPTRDRWFVPLVRIPLGTALAEELLFRAALLGLLLRVLSARRAVAASAVAFGLWHVVPAAETTDAAGLALVGAIVGTVLVTTVAGVVFAALRCWSHSVVAPVIAHVATNSFAYAAAIVALEVVD